MVEMGEFWSYVITEWPLSARLESLFSVRGRYFSRQICALRKTTFAAPPHM